MSVEFSKQEHWSRLPFPSPGDLPNPGIEPVSPALKADSLPSEPPGKPPSICFGLVQSLILVRTLCDPMDARFPCLSPTLRVYSNSFPLSQWCYLTIWSSVVPFSSHLESFPASGSFPVSQFFTSGGQNIGASASASVLPVNIQDWFPLGWTGWIALQSKGLSRVFSNTTVQKHQFFGSQLSVWSNYCWIQIYDNFYRSSHGRKNFQNI